MDGPPRPLNRAWANGHRVLQALHRRANRWRMGPDATAKIEHWQRIEEHGRQLEAALTSPAWVAVEQRREVYQRLRDAVMRSPSASHEARQQASVEWNAIQEFFRELRLMVREGQQARKALHKVQEATTA